MLQPMESTYQGYISSTHDALLVFECVRRGVMPKVKRRLREEERKLIRSGQVFVFDERESGIKRWTDGLVWSPSRILWNFLVYRQVDKKFGGRPGTAQKSQEASPQTMEVGLLETSSQSILASEYDPYALGVTTSADSGLFTSSIKVSPSQDRPTSSSNDEVTRNRSISSTTSDSFPNWVSNNDLTMGDETQPGIQPSQRAIDEERNLVGSLKSSYPFAKGGLCKKTISIQVDGTTQHLVSYYSVEDVRSGRLRTPSSLPEIASLTISPNLLTKTSFRFPPTIHLGPDGIPRFRGEDGCKVETGSNLMESSGEGNSSGSESRYTFYRSDPTVMRQHHSHTGMLPTGSSGMGGRLSSVVKRHAPMSHQVGGSGVFQLRGRSPDDDSAKSRRRSFEPYPKRASLKSISDESDVPPSPLSATFAPGGYTNRRLEGLPDQHHQVGSAAYYPHSFGHTAAHIGHDQTGINTIASGLTLNADDGLNPYKEEEDSRQRLMEELLADQIGSQETNAPWQSPYNKPMAVSRSEQGAYGHAYVPPFHYAPSGQSWSNTASIPQHPYPSFDYEQQQHRYGQQHPSSRAMAHHASSPPNQEELSRRQHHQNQQLDHSYTPSFVVSTPPNDVNRAALSHSFSHNRPSQSSYHQLYKTQSLPLRSVALPKRDDALPLA